MCRLIHQHPSHRKAVPITEKLTHHLQRKSRETRLLRDCTSVVSTGSTEKKCTLRNQYCICLSVSVAIFPPRCKEGGCPLLRHVENIKNQANFSSLVIKPSHRDPTDLCRLQEPNSPVQHSFFVMTVSSDPSSPLVHRSSPSKQTHVALVDSTVMLVFANSA